MIIGFIIIKIKLIIIVIFIIVMIVIVTVISMVRRVLRRIKLLIAIKTLASAHDKLPVVIRAASRGQ